MMLEFVTTLANVATLIVLAGGAVAAVVQFGHVRTGNRLAALLAVERSFAEPELQTALLYVQSELATRLTQAGYRRELAARGYVNPTEHPEMTVCNWFNELGTLVGGQFLPEDVAFESYARLVIYYWGLLSPTIALLRRERGPGQYAAFESLVRRVERWQRSQNDRPSRFALRSQLADPWATIDAGRTGGL